MKRVLSACLPFLISGFLSAKDLGIPFPSDVAELEQATESSGLREIYTYRTGLEVDELFEFYTRELRGLGFYPMNRDQSEGAGEDAGQLVFFDGENELVSIKAFYRLREGGDFTVTLTHIPNVRAAKAAKSASREERKALVDDSISGAELEFVDELDAIREAVNLRDFDGLYDQASPWFRSCFSDPEVRSQLQWLYVDELAPLRAIRRDNFATVVVRFHSTSRDGEKGGVSVLYFDKIGEQWCFNNLPFGQFELVVPERMTKAFSVGQ